ncbi:cytochrome P450 724B1-like [Iris pallida]|uniref:Cytochrome P450 724B1-like n=1 Tax=Iris pallida TaxID=29817 RepID=A0AAX6E9A2_IRIPA|nr:cytochrome P450 724B1-like [Iris pallida]
MEGELLPTLVIGLIVMLLLGLAFNHFLPLLLNQEKVIPRGSFGWPLAGETLNFLSPHASTSLGSFLEDHISRYGKIFKTHLFCTPTIVSCDQELNHFILQNEEKLFQCSYPKPIHGILGKSSMLVVVGETHRRFRNLALTMVSTTRSRPGYLNDIETTVTQTFQSWRGKGRVNFCEEARKFTFSVIVKQVLGLSQDEPDTARILEDFLTFMKGLISFPLYVQGTPYAKAVKARGRISLTVKAVMEQRRRGNGVGCCSNKKGDFLDVLLSVSNLTEEEKVSFVLDLLLGGYETTSILMSMAVYFLAQSPLALEKIKSEHQNIRANMQKDDYLNLEDYKKMEFTQHVISEALRCGILSSLCTERLSGMSDLKST